MFLIMALLTFETISWNTNPLKKFGRSVPRALFGAQLRIVSRSAIRSATPVFARSLMLWDLQLLLNECSLLTFQKPKNKEQSNHFPWQVSERDIQKSNHLPTLDEKHKNNPNHFWICHLWHCLLYNIYHLQCAIQMEHFPNLHYLLDGFRRGQL